MPKGIIEKKRVMKQVAILLLWAVVSVGCEKPEAVSPYRMRVANQTDKNFWRVVSYYDEGSNDQPYSRDFGFVAAKSSSDFISVSGPQIPLCNAIEVTTRDKSVRRPKEANCTIISFGPSIPGNYTLYISRLTDTGFEAVVKKD